MRYYVMARVTVDISRDVSADSLADAVEAAKKLEIKHFVAPAKGADTSFTDWEDFKIYGVCEA